MNDYLQRAAEARRSIFRRKAETVIRNMKRRWINGLFVETSKQAVDAMRSLVPEGSRVALGGSVTLFRTGVLDALRSMKIDLLDRYTEGLSREAVMDMRRQGMLADVLVSGCNAVTLDGKLVNQDGIGNRVAGMVFGPKKVVLVAGMNKLVDTVEDGIRRIKSLAAPMDGQWIKVETPCSKLGHCVGEACWPPNRICGQLVVIESSWFPDRIHVILVGEDLGF